MRLVCKIIEANNNSLKMLYLTQFSFNTPKKNGEMLLSALANSKINRLESLHLIENKVLFSSDESITSLCTFITQQTNLKRLYVCYENYLSSK